MTIKEFLLNLVSKVSKLLLILSTISFILGLVLAALPDFAGELGINLTPEILTGLAVANGSIAVAGGTIVAVNNQLRVVAAFNKSETQKILLKQKVDADCRYEEHKQVLKLAQIRHDEEISKIRLEAEKERNIINKELLERFNLLIKSQILNAERSIRLGISTDSEKEAYKEFIKIAATKVDIPTELPKISLKDILSKL